jgi:protein DGCR14
MSLSLSSTPKPNAEHTEQRSLDRQQILEEDEYTAALSHIIARDFFPSLVHLDATNNYLDAVSAHDPARIQSTVRRLQELNTPAARRRLPNQTPSQTPYGAGPSDTPLPMRTPQDTDGPPPSKKPRFDDSLTLDNFQARYTSEDNASFTQILQDENRERRATYAWAWDAQRRVELAKSRALEARERSLIEPPPVDGIRGKRFIEPPLPVAGLLTAGGEVEMDEEDRKEAVEDLTDEREVAVVLAEAEADDAETGAIVKRDEVVDVMARKKDTRVATVDGWKFKVRTFAASLLSAHDDVRLGTLSCSYLIWTPIPISPGLIKTSLHPRL